MQRIIMALRRFDTVFQGQYFPSLSIKKLRRHTDRQGFEKIATTIVLDTDEHLL